MKSGWVGGVYARVYVSVCLSLCVCTPRLVCVCVCGIEARG